MDMTFTCVPKSGLIKTNYFCRYFFPGEYEELYPEFNESNCNTSSGLRKSDSPTDYVFIFKRRIVIGDTVSRKNVRQFDTYSEMVPEIQKCFPKLKMEDIKKAMDLFSTIEIVPSPYDTIL